MRNSALSWLLTSYFEMHGQQYIKKNKLPASFPGFVQFLQTSGRPSLQPQTTCASFMLMNIILQSFNFRILQQRNWFKFNIKLNSFLKENFFKHNIFHVRALKEYFNSCYETKTCTYVQCVWIACDKHNLQSAFVGFIKRTEKKTHIFS